MTPTRTRRGHFFKKIGRQKFSAPGLKAESHPQKTKIAPPHGGRGDGARCTLLRKVVRMRAIQHAGGNSVTRHERRFNDAPHSLAMKIPRHASIRCRPVLGAFPPVVPSQTLPTSRRMPALPSCGNAELAIAPFGPVRPLRPWLVVNPGKGTAYASGFMAATVWPKQFPWRCAPSSRNKFFGPPGPPRCCGRYAVRPARPSPGGSPTRTRWARSCNPERKLHHG